MASVRGVYRGGLGVHLAMCSMAGCLGMEVDLANVPAQNANRDDVLLYSESAGRFILTVAPSDQERFEEIFASQPVACVGQVVSGPVLSIKGVDGREIIRTDVQDMKDAWKKTLWRIDMKKVRVLVLTGYGLNCDHETANAFSLAGAEPKRVHINSLIAGEDRLEDFQILAFGGGFSWGTIMAQG